MMISIQNSYYNQFGGSVDAVTTLTAPAVTAPRLGGLALLGYKRARVGARITLSSATTAGNATLKIVAGAVELMAVAVNLASSLTHDVETYIDLSGVEGQTPLVAMLDVTTAANNGTSATVALVMDVETPVIA